MTEPARTVATYLSGHVIALARRDGDALMATALDDARFGVDDAPCAASTIAGVTIERGQRFAISAGVAYVPITGLLTPNAFMFERYLGWSTYYGIEETFSELQANEDVRAVACVINSPGGMVLGIEAAARAIAQTAADKPVHALVHPMAASAAYWLAAQCTDIAMTPGSVAGCIGTRVGYYAPVEADFLGDQLFQFSSSLARAKAPDPTTPEGETEIRRSLDESETLFHDAVAAGRGIDRDGLAAQLSVTDDPQDGGAVFNPEDAIARGLADTGETYQAFMARVATSYAPSRREPSASYAARAAVARAQTAL